jgi:Protein of unknown function (DUF4242)
MAEFLLELYASRTEPNAVEAAAERARQAAEQLSLEGTRVRFLRTMFVPEEETCFYLYEAASAADVREAARRAELPSERVVEAIWKPLAEESDKPGERKEQR